MDGQSSEYPSAQYLLGMGQADNRNGASDQAYAAVARIFKVEVAAQAKDWESYLVVESRGSTQTERRLTLDNLTKVSTDKVLENVSIKDTWYDTSKGLYYALAAMNRPQAEASLMERMADLDRMVEVFGEEHGCRMFRKVAPWYAKRFGPANEFNKAVVHIQSRAAFQEVVGNYRRWRRQFLDDDGELKARFRPPPLVASFMREPGTARSDTIPVPKGPVELW